MKTTYFFLLILLSTTVIAQTNNAVPESWKLKSLSKIAPITLNKPDLSRLRAEDAKNDKNKSIPWRFGYDHNVSFGLENSGAWTTLKNGDRIWRVNFISPGALSLNLIFSDYHVPVGGKVFVYNNDRSEVLSVFTHLHNSDEGILGTWLVSGAHIWVEYYEPKRSKGLGKLHIGNIVHGYRTMENTNIGKNKNGDLTAKGLNDSDECHVDVNCDISSTSVVANEIKNNVKKSVGMVVVGGNGLCTGALVNNTNNDGTPYFLSANHCLDGSVLGWAFRFNWASDESVADCATTLPSTNSPFIQTASGAILRAANSRSDLALLEITDTAFFNSNPDVVWAGWNRSKTDIPALVVGIHHPIGDIQKVSVNLDGASRYSQPFNGDQNTQFWLVQDWELGVTQQGSSGSPLFNQDGLIIGKLSAGTAECIGTSGNGGVDVYGRFGVSWDDSSLNSRQLQFWLDPLGTNPITLDPYVRRFNSDAKITVRDISSNLCNSDEITPVLRVTNEGNNTLTSATISYQLDDFSENIIDWTGNLGTLEFEDITLPVITVSDDPSHSFFAEVSTPNGNADERTENNQFTRSFTRSIIYNTETSAVRVVITPDAFGNETTWTLTDANGTLIGNGGPYNQIFNFTTQPQQIVDVPITDGGCYSFTLMDTEGDGICCQFGAGTFQLQDDEGAILFNGDGEFGFETTHNFQIKNALSVNENTLSEYVKLYPNPVSTDFNLQIQGITKLSYDITNIVGQKIKNGSLNNGTHRISLKDQASGVYFIQITDDNTNQRISKKIVKY